MDRRVSTDRGEVFVPQMTDRMTALARTLDAGMQAEACPLQDMSHPKFDLG